MHRLLVTGSRDWADKNAIEIGLRTVWNSWDNDTDAVLIVGRCPTGADKIAEDIWVSWGLTVEPYPADWKRYGRGAGPIRNKQMLNADPDVCLAFMNQGSSGTANMAKLAQKAGLPVVLTQGT